MISVMKGTLLSIIDPLKRSIIFILWTNYVHRTKTRKPANCKPPNANCKLTAYLRERRFSFGFFLPCPILTPWLCAARICCLARVDSLVFIGMSYSTSNTSTDYFWCVSTLARPIKRDKIVPFAPFAPSEPPFGTLSGPRAAPNSACAFRPADPESQTKKSREHTHHHCKPFSLHTANCPLRTFVPRSLY